MPKRSLDSPSLQISKRFIPSAKAVEYSPSSDMRETWNTIGNCALAIQQYLIALSSFDSSLRSKPDDVDALIGLSKALKMRRNRDRDDPRVSLKQAAGLLISAIQNFPGNLTNEISIWKELAETHIETRDLEQAHLAINRGLNSKGEDTVANEEHRISLLLLSSDVSIRLSDLQYASSQLQTVKSYLSTKPSFNEFQLDTARETHHKLAAIANIEGHYKVATTEIQKVLTFSPPPPSRIEEYASYWNFLMIVREKAGDLEGALRISENAIEKVGFVPGVLIVTAYLHLIPNTSYYDPMTAVQLLESALNQEKITDTVKFNVSCKPAEEYEETGNFIGWYLLGKAFSYIDAPRQAYDAFQVALRKGPSSPLPWLAVGSLYLSMNQLPDSLAAYSQAAKLLVDDNSIASATANAAAWEGLACVYERCDDQAHDAADACNRASSCFRVAGNISAALLFEQRADILSATARGELPAPPLREPPNAPIDLLRDLMILTPKEEKLNTQHLIIRQLQLQQIPPTQAASPVQEPIPQRAAQQPSPKYFSTPKAPSSASASKISTPPAEPVPFKQFHHLPLPKESLVTKPSKSHREQHGEQHWSPRSEAVKQTQQLHQGKPSRGNNQHFSSYPPPPQQQQQQQQQQTPSIGMRTPQQQQLTPSMAQHQSAPNPIPHFQQQQGQQPIMQQGQQPIMQQGQPIPHQVLHQQLPHQQQLMQHQQQPPQQQMYSQLPPHLMQQQQQPQHQVSVTQHHSAPLPPHGPNAVFMPYGAPPHPGYGNDNPSMQQQGGRPQQIVNGNGMNNGSSSGASHTWR
ncbi:hypothetical protein WICPIJ_003244 [Wickerhamomyces pijperi]|uniref:Uncharacterized protein n=1 Tax=Wickerhamomyces pijperi TaxID=599730 RepID=A0A9P8Q891_WICPI|nr:hypothetical protein WICPIJ_003244 [Wickerhamomyces pijperi]